MKHLTVDRITEFVNMHIMDAASLELAAEVTEHIRACPDCLRKVRAYQLVSDGLQREILLGSEQENYPNSKIYSRGE